MFGCRNFRVTIWALGGKTLLVELALQIRREHRLRAWFELSRFAECCDPLLPRLFLSPHSRERISAIAIEYIKKHAKDDKPFFMDVNFMKMHNPTNAAPKFAGKSRLGDYSDSLMELDDNIGRVMDAIRAEAPNTIIIVTADNGAGGASDGSVPPSRPGPCVDGRQSPLVWVRQWPSNLVEAAVAYP